MKKKVFSIIAIILFTTTLMGTSKNDAEANICVEIASNYTDYMIDNYDVDMDTAIDIYITTLNECETKWDDLEIVNESQ
jgi:hypothetical protein